jgi:DNA-binding transcriptional LysR family regulator
MDIDLLRSFVAVCDAKSFTAAGRQVGRTQSAVSLQIRRLEESLGRPLFQRGVAGTVLTEHGALLLPHARHILESVNVALSAFDRRTIEGLFVIGMPDDYAPRILVPVLKATQALYPAAVVDLVTDQSRVLVKRLAEGSVDLAFITEGEGPSSGGPVAFTDDMVWVAPLDSELHRTRPLPIAVWDHDQDSYSLYMRARLEEIVVPYRVAVVARNMTGLRSAVTAGVAVSAMMRSSVGTGMRELSDLEGFAPLAHLSIRLEMAHLRKSAVVDALRDALLTAVAQNGR